MIASAISRAAFKMNGVSGVASAGVCVAPLDAARYPSACLTASTPIVINNPATPINVSVIVQV